MCIAIIDRMSQGQEAVSVHKARLRCRREHYVECDAREMPEEKERTQSLSLWHFSADKAGSVSKLHQDKNKFACN